MIYDRQTCLKLYDELMDTPFLYQFLYEYAETEEASLEDDADVEMEQVVHDATQLRDMAEEILGLYNLANSYISGEDEYSSLNDFFKTAFDYSEHSYLEGKIQDIIDELEDEGDGDGLFFLRKVLENSGTLYELCYSMMIMNNPVTIQTASDDGAMH